MADTPRTPPVGSGALAGVAPSRVFGTVMRPLTAADEQRVRNESVVHEGNILVNGRPFFPFGFYHVSWTGGTFPFTAQMAKLVTDMQWMATAGFNTIFCPIIVDTPEWEDFFDDCAAADIKVLSDDVENAVKPTFVNKPALLGWPIKDDVNFPCGAAPAGKTPADILVLHNAVKAIDPNHITYVSGSATCTSLGTSWTTYMDDRVDLCGLQSYPIGNPGVNPNPFMENYLTLKNGVDQAVPYQRPMIANIQCFDWPSEPMPTPQETRAFLYGAFMAGVRGVLYYTYFDAVVDIANEAALQAEFTLQAAEFNALQAALLGGTRSLLATGGFADVIAAQWLYQGTVYIAVLNTNETTARTPVIYSPNVTSGTATAMFPGRPSGMTYGSEVLTGSIAAKDVHVYSIPANVAEPGPSAISFVGSADGGTLSATTFSITLPVTQANDIIILEFSHRGTGNGTIAGTYTGPAFTLKHDQPFGASTFSAYTYYSRATGNHAGETVTGSGLTNTCAAIITIYRGALATGDPLTGATLVGEQNVNGAFDQTLAQITTTEDDTWVALVIGSSPDVAMTNQSGARMGFLTERVGLRSTGGFNSSISHASARKALAGPTGNFTWTQNDTGTASWAYAIRPVTP